MFRLSAANALDQARRTRLDSGGEVQSGLLGEQVARINEQAGVDTLGRFTEESGSPGQTAQRVLLSPAGFELTLYVC